MNSLPRIPEPVSITPAPGVYGQHDEMTKTISKTTLKVTNKLQTSSS